MTHFAILHGDRDQIERVSKGATQFFIDATFKIAPKLGKNAFKSRNIQVNTLGFYVLVVDLGSVGLVKLEVN